MNKLDRRMELRRAVYGSLKIAHGCGEVVSQFEDITGEEVTGEDIDYIEDCIERIGDVFRIKFDKEGN